MKRLLTPDEVADILSTSTDHLAQMRYRGDGPPFKRLTPKVIRYSETDLEAWVESTTRKDTK